MVHFNEDKLIIELVHPLPKEACCELKQAIIISLQAQTGELAVTEDDRKEANFVLLELLRQLTCENR